MAALERTDIFVMDSHQSIYRIGRDGKIKKSAKLGEKIEERLVASDQKIWGTKKVKVGKRRYFRLFNFDDELNAVDQYKIGNSRFLSSLKILGDHHLINTNMFGNTVLLFDGNNEPVSAWGDGDNDILKVDWSSLNW